MDAALVDFCTGSFTLDIAASADKNSKIGYGSSVNYSGRLENKTEFVILPNGDVMKTRGRVFLVPNGTVPRAGIDRITLPATELVRQPPIVKVNVEPAEDGSVDHIVLYFA